MAAGKSTVSDQFKHLEVPVYDADVIARDLVQPGQPALQELADKLGKEIIGEDGALNRAYVRNIVFSDASKRKYLEAVLHPRIRAALQASAQKSPGPYCVLVIPLLIECYNQYRWTDRILVVDVTESVQMDRLLQRPGITEELARQILNAQADRTERLNIADDVIRNEGTEADLKKAVDELHKKYLFLAKNKLLQYG